MNSKTLSLCACLAFAACAQQPYHPVLTTPPNDPAAYQQALLVCTEQSKPTTGDKLITGAFGPIGMLLAGAAGNERMMKSTKQIIDECLTTQGYEVKA